MLDQHPTPHWRSAHALHALLALVLGLMGLHQSVAVAHADELIVDDAAAAVEVSGTWEASATTTGFYGGGYLFHEPGHGAALVRWPFPAAGAPGRYQVYVRWSGGPNRASAAAYEIRHAAGTTTVRLDQQAHGGRWQSLGIFRFQPGHDQNVALSGEADGIVIADAVAFAGPLDAGPTAGLTDLAAVQPVQAAVDTGDQPWRLDPLAVARADAHALGFDFSARDPMHLVEQDPPVARIRAEHDRTTYDIQVVQPARLGPTGIWVLQSIRAVGPAVTPP